MVRELIAVQVGQCGNQIGRRFWQQALDEHASNNPEGVFDDCMSTFFRNVDGRYDRDLPVGDGRQPIYNLKARAVLVDMESGPVAETFKGPLGDLFDERQSVTDVSGSGNNWAHGHALYGPQYAEELLEAVRRSAEFCDSLQSFFLMHSMGGGTGSGLGTYLLSLLEDNFPNVYRFTTAVFPSEDDDVITSPYNTVLAMRELTEHADCVLPVDNQSLADLATRSSGASARQAEAGFDGAGTKAASAADAGAGFDNMNGVVGRLLTDLTSSMRFAGDLNVDLNEITTNLVPYPRLHYLMSSLSPLPASAAHSSSDGGSARRGSVGRRASRGARGASGKGETAASALGNRPRHMKQMFSDAFASSNQLMRADPRRGRFLACGLLLRGDVVVSDVNSNVERLTAELKLVPWNREGFKIGLCAVPPVGETQSLLAVSNNCCIRDTFGQIRDRFMQLYARRAMVHHYTQFVDGGVFGEALESLNGLITDYAALDVPDEEHHALDGRSSLMPVF